MNERPHRLRFQSKGCALLSSPQGQVDLVSVVDPAGKVHTARLLVKREVPKVHAARGTQSQWRDPDQVTGSVGYYHGV